MDLKQEIVKALDHSLKNNVPEIIEKNMQSMMERIIRDLFQSWGHLSKQVKEEIEKNMNVNLEKQILLDYNVLVGKLIADNLIESFNMNSAAPIMECVNEITGYIENKEVKLSEIADMFIEAAMEENMDYDGEISLHIEYNAERNWHNIFIDKERNKDKNQCAVRFVVFGDGRMACFAINDHWNHGRVFTPLQVANYDKVQNKIFRLYAAGVKVEVDVDDDYAYWNRDN